MKNTAINRTRRSLTFYRNSPRGLCLIFSVNHQSFLSSYSDNRWGTTLSVGSWHSKFFGQQRKEQRVYNDRLRVWGFSGYPALDKYSVVCIFFCRYETVILWITVSLVNQKRVRQTQTVREKTKTVYSWPVS